MKFWHYLFFFLLIILFNPLPADAKGFINPDSKLYFTQIWAEDIRLFFTFSKEKKIEYLIQLTERRVDELAQIQELDQKRASYITEHYHDHFAKMKKIVSGLSEDKKAPNAEKIKSIGLVQQKELSALLNNNIPEDVNAQITDIQTQVGDTLTGMITDSEGSKAANEFIGELQAIQKMAQQNQMQKTVIMPMEAGAPSANPEETEPKELLPILEEREGMEILDQGQGFETEPSDKNPMMPIAPAPMQTKN